MPRKMRYYGLVLLALLAVFALPAAVSRPRSAFAAGDAAACKASATLAGASVSGVPAVITACDNCAADSLGQRRGTLWLGNPKGGAPARAMAFADRNVGGRDDKITFNMYGMTYTCGHAGDTSPTTATNIEIRNAAGNARIGEISLSSTELVRGTNGSAYSWTPGAITSGHTVNNLDSFFATESTCTDLGRGARDCTRTVQVYRCFNGSGCGLDPSEIRAVVNDTTIDDNAKNRFYSKSTVQIPRQGSDISGYKSTSGKDGSVRLKISTDEPTVEVNFGHRLFYEVKGQFGSGDTVERPSMDYEVKSKYGFSTQWDDLEFSTIRGSAGTWRPSSGKSDDESGWLYRQGNASSWMYADGEDHSNSYATETVKVRFTDDDHGKTKRVCRRFKYDKKYVDYIVSGFTGSSYNWSIEQYRDPRANERTWSQACAYITYVGTDADGGDPLAKGNVTLGASAGTAYAMLAGEDANLSISGSAKGVMTRRLIGKEAVVFNHGANVTWDPALVARDTRFKDTDLCKLFKVQRFPNALDCQSLVKYSVSYEEQAEEADTKGELPTDTTAIGATVAVPDDIGQKYCNAFGYKFRYYVGTQKGSANGSWDDTTWREEPSKDYTYVPGPACRTIAKKPTAAFWNGSVLMANGSIVTSLAKRHIINGSGPQLGYMTPAGGVLENAQGAPVVGDSRTLYGSWSEYLAMSSKPMSISKAIGSGSSLSLGASGSTEICNNVNHPWVTNSPLTVANVGCSLGNAGETLSSSSFRTRLETYLQHNLANIEAESLINMQNIVSGTKILDWRGHTDPLWITNDIIIDKDATHTYGLRNLPQVIVIADGDINIADNVKRIDAWLITKGTIHTCVFSGAAGGYILGNTAEIKAYNDQISSDGVGVTSLACANQLVFNGPVVAGNMDLQRSFGADSQAKIRKGLNTAGANVDTSRESSAEIFNLRADTYLWAYAQAARYASSYSEAYTRELAPRY